MRILTLQAHGKNGDFEGNIARLLEAVGHEHLTPEDLIVTSQGALFGFDMKSYNGNHPVMFAAFEHMLEQVSSQLPCPLIVPLIYHTSFSMLEEPVIFYVEPQGTVTVQDFDASRINALDLGNISIAACTSNLLYSCGEIATQIMETALDPDSPQLDADAVFLTCLNQCFEGDDESYGDNTIINALFERNQAGEDGVADALEEVGSIAGAQLPLVNSDATPGADSAANTERLEDLGAGCAGEHTENKSTPVEGMNEVREGQRAGKLDAFLGGLSAADQASVLDCDENPPAFLLCFTADPYEFEGECTHTGISVSLFSYSRKISRALTLPVVVSGEVGGYDKRVYVGGSFIVDAHANLIASAPRAFEEAAFATDLENPILTPHAQAVIEEMGRYCLFDIEKPATNHQVLRWFAMRRGLKDYVHDAGFTQVILGLSGGLDSAVVAELAAQALGPQAVTGVIMPSTHTSPESLADANEVVERLGIKTLTIPINDLVGSVKAFFGLDTNQPSDLLAYQNLQSRLRGVILMTLSNHTRSLVLSTTNKSEALLGYSTLYGDTVGAYAPLVDVYKSQMVEMLDSFERDGFEISVLPKRLRVKPPTAELSDNQTDEADLGVDYATLDRHLDAILSLRHAESDLGARFDRSLLEDLVTRMLANEYKRRQEPLGPLFTWPDPERPVMHPILCKLNAHHFIEALAALPSYEDRVDHHLSKLSGSLPAHILDDLRSYLLEGHEELSSAPKQIGYQPSFVFDEGRQERIVHYQQGSTFDDVDLTYRTKGLRRVSDQINESSSHSGEYISPDQEISSPDPALQSSGQTGVASRGGKSSCVSSADESTASAPQIPSDTISKKPSPWPEQNRPTVKEIDPKNQEMLQELSDAVRQAMKASRRSPGSFDSSLFERN